MIGLVSEVLLETHGDERGSLVSIEEYSDAFLSSIGRVYYIFDTISGQPRGFHAHRHLEQLLIAVNGSCEIVTDRGNGRRRHLLNDRRKALKISGLVWREMHNFSPDAVLLIVASEVYNESDYIRSYEHFLSEVVR